MTNRKSVFFAVVLLIIGIIAFGILGFRLWWNHNIGSDIPMPVLPGDTIPDTQDIEDGRLIELAEGPGKDAVNTVFSMLKSGDPKAFLEIGSEEDAKYTIDFYDWASIDELIFDGNASVPKGNPLETDYYCHIDENSILRVLYSFTDEGKLLEIKKVTVEKSEIDEDGSSTLDIAEIG